MFSPPTTAIGPTPPTTTTPTSATIRVSLSPIPAFCIKSSALGSSSSTECRLSNSSVISVPRGIKIFVNIAWDHNIPPPPDGSEEAIQKAMLGEGIDQEDALLLGSINGGHQWFVPVVVSEPREDNDKAGRPSVVFDSIYHSSLKSRALRDPEFKTFLIELAFQRIEAQTGLQLSRQIGSPNIPSKGKLIPRSALIPAALYPPAQLPAHHAVVVPARTDAGPLRKGKLVQEIGGENEQQTPLKGILKGGESLASASNTAAATPGLAAPAKSDAREEDALPCPEFTWNCLDGVRRITFKVPKLTRADIPRAILDVEPRRFILRIPGLYALDLDLDAPDASLREQLASLPDAVQEQALTLKRQKDLDVDGARAEWRIAEGVVILYA